MGNLKRPLNRFGMVWYRIVWSMVILTTVRRYTAENVIRILERSIEKPSCELGEIFVLSLTNASACTTACFFRVSV